MSEIGVNVKASATADPPSLLSFSHSSARVSEPSYQRYLSPLKSVGCIPEPEIALDFAAMLFRDYPRSFVWVMLLSAWYDFRSKGIEQGQRGAPFGSYFDSVAEFACEIARVDGVSMYVCPNPVRKSGRPASHLYNNLGKVGKGQGVRAGDIEFLRWLIIDIDPVVTGSRHGVNSTADEHQACQDLLRAVLDGEPAIASASMGGSSGNGAHLLVRSVEHRSQSPRRPATG